MQVIMRRGKFRGSKLNLYTDLGQTVIVEEPRRKMVRLYKSSSVHFIGERHKPKRFASSPQVLANQFYVIKRNYSRGKRKSGLIMPHDGICWRCGHDITADTRIQQESKKSLVSGCPNCHRSFLD